MPNIILPPVPLPPTRDPSTPSKLMEEAGEEDKWTMEESQWELVGGDPSPLHARKGRRKMEVGDDGFRPFLFSPALSRHFWRRSHCRDSLSYPPPPLPLGIWVVLEPAPNRTGAHTGKRK